MQTESFKELEAYAVLGRVPVSEQTLVVASAGNTASAFASLCSANQRKCLLIIPERALQYMHLAEPVGEHVSIVAVRGGDYADAIRLAALAANIPDCLPEGGVRNVARRDGLGTVLLNAWEAIGHMPDYYFQAIGSGSGAIAVLEAALRLTSGNGPVPRLWLSQNHPVTPVVDAWRSGSRILCSGYERSMQDRIESMYAQVLSNRTPPYSIKGGLHDALMRSQGTVISVTNTEAELAAQVFSQHEGVTIAPAAAVAFASLLKSARQGLLPQEATVLLNITGGCQTFLNMERVQWRTKAHLIVGNDFNDSDRIIEQIQSVLVG